MKRYLLPIALALSACATGQTPTEEPIRPRSTTTSSAPSPFARQILDEHNRVRQAEGAGLADLAWSSELASFAQSWANELKNENQCQMRHRSGQQRYLKRQITGENLFRGGSSRPYKDFMWQPATVVQAWASEKPFYSFTGKSCRSGEMCGHYTQIVWKSTTHVGCGRALCGSSEVWVCNYLPAGNYVGENPY